MRVLRVRVGCANSMTLSRCLHAERFRATSTAVHQTEVGCSLRTVFIFTIEVMLLYVRGAHSLQARVTVAPAPHDSKATVGTETFLRRNGVVGYGSVCAAWTKEIEHKSLRAGRQAHLFSVSGHRASAGRGKFVAETLKKIRLFRFLRVTVRSGHH